MKPHTYRKTNGKWLHAKLIEYKATRDEIVARELYEQLLHLASAAITKLLHDDDIVHDAVVKLMMHSIDKYEGNEKTAVNYCYTIFRNYAIDILRKRNTQVKYCDHVGTNIEVAAVYDIMQV